MVCAIGAFNCNGRAIAGKDDGEQNERKRTVQRTIHDDATEAELDKWVALKLAGELDAADVLREHLREGGIEPGDDRPEALSGEINGEQCHVQIEPATLVRVPQPAEPSSSQQVGWVRDLPAHDAVGSAARIAQGWRAKWLSGGRDIEHFDHTPVWMGPIRPLIVSEIENFERKEWKILSHDHISPYLTGTCDVVIRRTMSHIAIITPAKTPSRSRNFRAQTSCTHRWLSRTAEGYASRLRHTAGTYVC